jgi:hypothetical protein
VQVWNIFVFFMNSNVIPLPSFFEIFENMGYLLFYLAGVFAPIVFSLFGGHQGTHCSLSFFLFFCFLAHAF